MNKIPTEQSIWREIVNPIAQFQRCFECIEYFFGVNQ